MLKSKAKKAGGIALAGMMAMGGLLAAGTDVHAANTIQGGDTPVSYDNRKVLPDGNAEYGMIIPTAIAFTNEKTTADADVEITGINGHDLTEWSDLTVTASVKSKNSYKLVGEGNADGAQAGYTLTYTGNTGAMKANAEVQEITQKLGTGGSAGAKAKAEGEAALGADAKQTATKKGVYKDQLTYSFTEVSNVKK